jgi:competence protein ComEC
MRAPLLVPALLVLDAITVARDFGDRDVCVLAVVAGIAALSGRTRAHVAAASAVAFGLSLSTWHVSQIALTSEVPGATLRGVVASDVASQPRADSFELLADDGRRYAVAVRERVAVGERLTIQGRLEPFDEPRNPGEPSARRMGFERGVFARLSQGRILSRAPPNHGDARTLPPRIRAEANALLRRLLAEPDATILAGMLYGARGSLSPELRAEFQDTGTVHVLVTAGLHLGVVAVLLTFLLTRIGLGTVAASLGAIPPIWLYAIVSGAHLPSLRAATMVTVALAARALGERAISLNTLAFAAIVVATIWPASVGSASFALSFSCVGAIVIFAEPIATFLERLRVPAMLREALALTLSTQLGVWPLTAATFLVIAPYAALANLFVVPVVGIALIGGIAMLTATPLWPLASILARIEAWPLAWIEGAVHLTAGLPFAHIAATPPPLWTIALYDAAMVVAGVFIRVKGRSQRASG